MNGLRIGAVLLIIAGTLGLVYGQFSYGRNARGNTFGPVGFFMRNTHTVNVPVWASVGAIVAGSLLLLAHKRSYHS